VTADDRLIRTLQATVTFLTSLAAGAALSFRDQTVGCVAKTHRPSGKAVTAAKKERVGGRAKA
jgi:hypothetical protein